MSWLFSRALVEEYSAGNCLGGERSVPLNTTNTPAMFLSHGKTTDALNLSRFGMMCEPLKEGRGEELLTWYLAGFRVKILAQVEEKKELKEQEAGYGKKCEESFVKYDQVLHLWKTHQTSLFGDSEEFSETWPRQGTMQNGECLERIVSDFLTFEKECGLLPTPVHTEAESFIGGPIRNDEQWSTAGRLSHRLIGFWKNWDGRENNGRFYDQKVVCHPIFAEWMMMWPFRWSALQGLETDKFREWLRLHGAPSHNESPAPSVPEEPPREAAEQASTACNSQRDETVQA